MVEENNQGKKKLYSRYDLALGKVKRENEDGDNMTEDSGKREDNNAIVSGRCAILKDKTSGKTSDDKGSKLEEIVDNPQVLVVDGEYHEDSIRSVRGYDFVGPLEGIGYRFKAVSTGKEALDTVNDFIDLVILNLNTKDMPGVEVAKRIKTKAPDSEVVVYSAEEVSEKDLFNAGVFDFVYKPCGDKNSMINLVEEAIKHKEFTLRYIGDLKSKLFRKEEDKTKKMIIYCAEEKSDLSKVLEHLRQKDANYVLVEKSYDSILKYVGGIKPNLEKANSLVVLNAGKGELIKSISDVRKDKSNFEIPVLALLSGYDEDIMIEAFEDGASDCATLSPDKFSVVAEHLFDAHKVKYSLGKEGKLVSIRDAVSRTEKPVFFVIDNKRIADRGIEDLLISEGFNTKVVNSLNWRKIGGLFKPNYMILDLREFYDSLKKLIEGRETFYFSKLYAETMFKDIKLVLKGDQDSIPEYFHNLIERGHVHFIHSSLRNHEFKRRIMEILDHDMGSGKKKGHKGNYILIPTGATGVGKNTVANQIVAVDKSFEIVPNYKDRSQYRLGESRPDFWRGLFLFNKYHYEAYGGDNYVNVEGIMNALGRGKNVIVPCSADGAKKIEELVNDKDISTDIVTICLRGNDGTLVERLKGDKTRSPEEVEKRSKNLGTDRYNLDDNSFDDYIPTDSISPIEVARKILEKANQAREGGSLYYRKSFADNLIKKVLPGGYGLKYLIQSLSSNISVPLFFTEENFRCYVKEKGLDEPTREKIGRRKILAAYDVNGVLGIYLENRDDTEESKRHLIGLFTKELGQPNMEDDSINYNLSSYYTNTHLINKSTSGPIKTTNLVSYSSGSAPKKAEYPHTVSFVIVDKCDPADINILTKITNKK